MPTLKEKLTYLIYGHEIGAAIRLDNLLGYLQTLEPIKFTNKGFNQFTKNELDKDLSYLEELKLITCFLDNSYQTTKLGDLKLASGGFTNDIKNSKNALYSFKISIVSITIAILAFLDSCFCRQ